MTKINSKNKGNRFERTIAKWLEDWTGYKFARTPGSGGWAKAKDSFGDITCVDEKHARRFPFSIELKSYEDIRFEHILLELKTCKVLSFWEQARSDAKRAKAIPLLLMKYNGMPKDEAFFVLEKELWDEWIKTSSEELNFTKPKMAIEMSTGGLVFYIVMASDIKQQSYNSFYKAARKLVKQRYKE